MEKIKQFFEEFATYEAELESLKSLKDFGPYNQGVHKGNMFYVQPWLVNMPKSRQMRLDRTTPVKRYPRSLFKVSHYKHETYKDVWLCFCSDQDHSGRKGEYLTKILAVIETEEGFKIVATYTYSNYESDGHYYEWTIDHGSKSLNLDGLENPIEIVRYQVPAKAFDGLKHYEKEW